MKRHIIFWIGFLVWDILQVLMSLIFSSDPIQNPVLMSSLSGILDMLLKVVLFYALFYLVYVPVLKKTITSFAAFIVALLVTTALLIAQRYFMVYVVMGHLWHTDPKRINFWGFYSLVVTLFDMLVPVFLLFIYELYIDSRQTREKQIQLEKEKLQSELRFLKAQINPHFLFNVLGTIHALALQKAPEAANVTIRLSKIMRYMLYETGSTRVPISEEIKLLEDYIALEHTRFSNKLEVSFTKEVPDNLQNIAPLILLPFVENAFKHGPAESRAGATISIRLVVTGKDLFFEVHNSVEPGEAAHKEKGIGLANIRRQLELLYPDHHLRINSEAGSYSVFLNLQL